MYRSISKFAGTVSNKKILDIGCGIKPYQPLFKDCEYLGIEVGNDRQISPFADKIYDGEHVPYQDASFDAVLCTQVLEHANHPDQLVKEIRRVLKPGGLAYITMPFVWNEHEKPYDFRRFTSFEHNRLLNSQNLDIRSISPTCGVFGVCGQLISAYIVETFGTRYNIVYQLVTLLLCAPMQIIFLALDGIFKNNWITLDYVIIAEKNAQE